MNITKLTAENVKRITAVTVTPDGALVKVGGKNGSGKTSALDSIAWALGGERLVPSEPIRQGETDAKIVVEVGNDLIVTRTFRRERLLCSCSTADHPDVPLDAHPPECAKHKFGETISRLRVTNKAGASYPSPQAVLDKLVGSLAFDPMEFMREKPAKQADILRRLAGLDFAKFDADRKLAVERRAMAKKTLAIKESQISLMPRYTDIGDSSETSMDEIAHKMDDAERCRKVADYDARSVEKAEATRDIYQHRCEETRKNIEEAEALLERLKESLADAEHNLAEAHLNIETKQAIALASRAAVPDVAELKAELTHVEEHNRKVRANSANYKMSLEVMNCTAEVQYAQKAIEVLDQQKETLLTSAHFPIPGLGVNDDGATLNSVPLVQASSAEQLRVSLAIGLALNPTLKVMIVRNGNMLDEDSMKLVAEMAETAGAQIWCEIVTASAEGMTVLLEDGHVQ